MVTAKIHGAGSPARLSNNSENNTTGAERDLSPHQGIGKAMPKANEHPFSPEPSRTRNLLRPKTRRYSLARSAPLASRPSIATTATNTLTPTTVQAITGARLPPA